jgi:hypothetical protein
MEKSAIRFIFSKSIDATYYHLLITLSSMYVNNGTSTQAGAANGTNKWHMEFGDQCR